MSRPKLINFSGNKAYDDYISSKKWKRISNKAKRRAGNRCQLCNRPDTEIKLHTHHRTYERFGRESLDDLTVLCEDCHRIFESKSSHRPAKNVNNKKKCSFDSLLDKIPFGKYKGKAIQYVINYDPSYILWMDEDKVARINPAIINLACQSLGGKSKPSF